MRSRSLLQLNLRMAPPIIKQRANSFPELGRGPIDDKLLPGVVLLAGSGSDKVRELAKRLAAEELKRIDFCTIQAESNLEAYNQVCKSYVILQLKESNRLPDFWTCMMWASIKPISDLFRFQRTRRNSDQRDTPNQEIQIQGAAVLLRDKWERQGKGLEEDPLGSWFCDKCKAKGPDDVPASQLGTCSKFWERMTVIWSFSRQTWKCELKLETIYTRKKTQGLASKSLFGESV
ncbi:hypothetical protein BY996DRAFT_6518306 [Phakopsora pachyrhizi]|nr:hypothetical protein BY996DRAFT_6518306 [Phakopsora pachyrhizi]